MFVIYSDEEKYGCPAHGWRQYLNSCYLFVQEKISWTDALKYCHKQGGELASIADESEQNFIWSQLPQGNHL